MKLRSGTLIVVLFIGVNYFTLAPDAEYKKSVQEQVIVAIKYYKDKAYNYYQKITGQIPPPIITNHYGDWIQFQIVCDAFLMDSHQAEEIFARYIRSRNSVIQESTRNRQLNPNRMSREDGLAVFTKRQRSIIDSFKNTIINDFTAGELAAIEELLLYPRIFPNPDLRALRMIKLDDNQRKAIRPLAIQMIKSYPKFTLGYPTTEIIVNAESNESGGEKAERLNNQELLKAQINKSLTEKQAAQWKGQLGKALEAVQEYRDHQEYRSRYFFTRRRFPLTTNNAENTTEDAGKNTPGNADRKTPARL
jgi:hypothetical protein